MRNRSSRFQATRKVCWRHPSYVRMNAPQTYVQYAGRLQAAREVCQVLPTLHTKYAGRFQTTRAVWAKLPTYTCRGVDASKLHVKERGGLRHLELFHRARKSVTPCRARPGCRRAVVQRIQLPAPDVLRGPCAEPCHGHGLLLPIPIGPGRNDMDEIRMLPFFMPMLSIV